MNQPIRHWHITAMLVMFAAAASPLPVHSAEDNGSPTPPVAGRGFELRIAETEPRDGLVEAIVKQSGETIWLHESAVATSRDVRTAKATRSSDGLLYEVAVTFTKHGASRLAEATAKNIKERIALIVDGRVLMAPTILSPFSSVAQLAGNFTKDDAEQLASRISPAGRPNIVLIMSDDMGFSDIGCYGGEIETPVLDRLARDGLRFTQFYNTGRCCPTRASLLTGLYPHQAGVGHMLKPTDYVGYQSGLNSHCLTIAEVLRPAGYRTYISGKWHVTRFVAPEGPKHNWPLHRGFDRFYGTILGAGSFFDPGSLTRDNTQISPAADPEYQPETYYYTDAISDHAVRFIREHEADHAEQPLFLYVAYTSAHWPMHALPEDIAKYRGRYDDGYQSIRKTRFERMKRLDLIPSDAKLSPQARHWNDVNNREWEARCMEVYAAMIDRMDQGIGRIVDTLAKTGRLEDTLILFLQDNGGCAETLGRTPSEGKPGKRPNQPDAPMPSAKLQRNMIPNKTRDGWPMVLGTGVMPGPADTYIAYGEGWANVSNTPFREYKHWVHEGGISTPLIAHWPAGISRRGELERQSGHLIDVMATCVDVSGAAYPNEVNGSPIHPLEGLSLLPAFAGEPLKRESLYWEHEGNRAVRQGNWKLVAKCLETYTTLRGSLPESTGPWELYRIDRDRAELHDLVTKEPARVRRMAVDWESWAERASVHPLAPYVEKSN